MTGSLLLAEAGSTARSFWEEAILVAGERSLDLPKTCVVASSSAW